MLSLHSLLIFMAQFCLAPTNFLLPPLPPPQKKFDAGAITAVILYFET